MVPELELALGPESALALGKWSVMLGLELGIESVMLGPELDLALEPE
jgi:hypothetical protein